MGPGVGLDEPCVSLQTQDILACMKQYTAWHILHLHMMKPLSCRELFLLVRVGFEQGVDTD